VGVVMTEEENKLLTQVSPGTPCGELMALTLEECEEMNLAADQYGVKLLCGHTKSFDPPIRKMREVISSGELGKL